MNFGDYKWGVGSKDAGFDPSEIGWSKIPGTKDWGEGADQVGGGYGDIKPGYKNPLSGGGFWDKLSTFNNLFDKTKQTDKWQNYATSKDKAYGGDWSRTGAGQVLENLGVVYPQQFSPMYIPGAPGEAGKGGAIGKAAGLALGLAAAPFTGGASLGAIPFLSGAGGTIGGVFD